MPMSEHLHLPLRLAPNRADTLVNAFGVTVCTTVSVDQAMPIMRAVNAHDAMLAALQAVLGELQYIYETGDVRDSQRNGAEAVSMAERAIAKAEG